MRSPFRIIDVPLRLSARAAWANLYSDFSVQKPLTTSLLAPGTKSLALIARFRGCKTGGPFLPLWWLEFDFSRFPKPPVSWKDSGLYWAHVFQTSHHFFLQWSNCVSRRQTILDTRQSPLSSRLPLLHFSQKRKWSRFSLTPSFCCLHGFLVTLTGTI